MLCMKPALKDLQTNKQKITNTQTQASDSMYHYSELSNSSSHLTVYQRRCYKSPLKFTFGLLLRRTKGLLSQFLKFQEIKSSGCWNDRISSPTKGSSSFSLGRSNYSKPHRIFIGKNKGMRPCPSTGTAYDAEHILGRNGSCWRSGGIQALVDSKESMLCDKEA